MSGRGERPFPRPRPRGNPRAPPRSHLGPSAPRCPGGKGVLDPLLSPATQVLFLKVPRRPADALPSWPRCWREYVEKDSISRSPWPCWWWLIKEGTKRRLHIRGVGRWESRGVYASFERPSSSKLETRNANKGSIGYLRTASRVTKKTKLSLT